MLPPYSGRRRRRPHHPRPEVDNIGPAVDHDGGRRTDRSGVGMGVPVPSMTTWVSAWSWQDSSRAVMSRRVLGIVVVPEKCG